MAAVSAFILQADGNREGPSTRDLRAEVFTQPRPRLCENVHEPRTRSIVFSIVFSRWRPSVRSFFRLTEIEKDLLRAICAPRFSHSLAPNRSSNSAPTKVRGEWR